MVKGVFDTRPNSAYDDDAPVRYHFPSQYRAVAERLVGGWVVYREPRREGGRQGYVAVARVTRIEVDRSTPGHAYAYVDSYLAFDTVVPFKRGDRYAEDPLRLLVNQSQAGQWLQGKSIRLLDEGDFTAIVREGLSDTLDPGNAVRWGLDDPNDRQPIDLAWSPDDRRIEQILMNRKIRDASFRRMVCAAYNDTCAITRLRIINGGGRAEAQAAHIVPVAAGGPDIVQNGIALSSTIHWLFDRHLISIDDEYRLLVSHNKVPPEIRSLISRHGEAIMLPDDRSAWPALTFVRRHRAQFGDG
jgi:putative restriction endonuclease